MSPNDKDLFACWIAPLFRNDVVEALVADRIRLPCCSIPRIGQGRLDVLGCSAERRIVMNIARADLRREMAYIKLKRAFRDGCAEEPSGAVRCISWRSIEAP